VSPRPSVLALAVVAVVVASLPASASTTSEAQNWSKQSERYRYQALDPDTQLAVHDGLPASVAAMASTAAADPTAVPLTICSTHVDGCAGDPRLSGWARDGRRSVPVHFVNPNGALLSGHLWLGGDTRRPRPAVVITTGSIQAPEQAYWWAAETLAAHGYLVLTFDSQGQGSSSTLGSGSSTLDGVPGEPLANFVTNTRAALDFLTSTDRRPYLPTTADGRTRQQQEVAAGRAAAYDPLWRDLDPHRIGLAGHSSGAYADSYLATVDPRVKAVVAWDNLEVRTPRGLDGTGQGGVDTDPPLGPEPFRPRVPALGLSVDYGVDSGTGGTFSTGPFDQAPAPARKLEAFRAYRAAGVDTAEIVIRGGTHFEFSYLLTPALGATLRGIDLAAWYTTAWFDRYLRHDRTATSRLLSDRWRHDEAEARVDPTRDGNMFSTYFPSEMSLRVHDQAVECTDLRAGCSALVPTSRDGWPGPYDLTRDALKAG
jgi:dienelactone hydrolase